jgi:outer membrane protein with beta-barrel domain
MRRVTGLVSLVAVLAFTSTLEAQHRELERRGYLGVGGGLGVPSGQFGADANLGWLGQAYAGYTTRGGIFGARLDATFGRNPFGSLGGFWTAGGTVNAVFTPGHRPAGFHPYLLGGAGAYYVDASGGTGETAVALNGGAGVQFHLGHRSDFYVEGRFLTIRTERAVNLFPITLGFRWGGI